MTMDYFSIKKVSSNMSKANWLSIITSMVLQLCLGLFVYK
ncbi:hypothetical protein H3996_00795 [Staphylococcus epidermidis]|nr:hypothetical protein EGX64_11685 [Staphylococcus epidermidis]KAA9372734.1 hypothetical protein F6I16_12065 [Staphylococcus epidermidis]KAB2228420.1 hypothetical protein F9B46_00850 [Staphylococcus epidermidis]MBB1175895.1 hypothetical protein [Staphylococcus epidermidis]MBE7302985.1 hypothetical protein [Staphylococcus epidermidis]